MAGAGFEPPRGYGSSEALGTARTPSKSARQIGQWSLLRDWLARS